MAAHDAASGNDLAMRDWNPVGGSADADLLPDLDTLTARSRDLGRNNGLMAGGTQTLRDNIVGAVLRLSATPDYRLLGWTREKSREWGNITEAKFRSWAETVVCDASRTQNLLGLTLQALGGAMLNGDALGLPLWLPRPGSRWNTRLMMVESDRLMTPVGLEHREDSRAANPWCRPSCASSTWPASMRPTSCRRASPTRWSRLFLESDLDPASAAELFGENPREAWNASVAQTRNIRQLKGAAVIPLPAGARLSSFTPGRPNQAFEAFMLASLRHIAAGMNLPYELLLKDFSKSNYSSARAALLEAWRYFHGRRRWLSDYWLRAIYEL